MRIKMNAMGILVAALVAPMLMGVSARAVNLFWQPTSGTSSWFTAANWNTAIDGSGSSLVPTFSDIAQLEGGVCSVDAGSNAVADRVENYAYWQGGTEYTLDIEAGATLTVSNYFRIGNQDVSGTVNARGNLVYVNNNNNGFVLGGYSASHTNALGVLNIDGGTVTVGQINFGPMLIGGSSVGRVEISNGGSLYVEAATFVGSGASSESDGTVVVHDGVWTNKGSVSIGKNSGAILGRGTVIINGGEFYSLPVGYSGIAVGAGGVGRLEVNGGKLVGPHAFNSLAPNANRTPIAVGVTAGGTGTFIQNGGIVESVGLVLGRSDSDGSGTAILSNGVFNAMSNNGSWPCLRISDSGHMIVDGGDFLGYTNSGIATLHEGGVLEMRSGTFALSGSAQITTASNAIIRIVGPLSQISAWWRHTSGDPSNAVMELILTKEAGHLTRMESPSSLATAVPGTLRVGFDGGACLLATNQFPYLWAQNYFDNDRAKVADYDLDLWDVSELWQSGLGEEASITLKPAESQGAAALPTDTVSGGGKAYGYVVVDTTDTGTLPELIVNMNLTEVDGTIADVVTDLQAAGYTNSWRSGNVVSMTIPLDNIPADSGYFAWDFREFDGSTNATVSSIGFKIVPQGTLITVH